MRYGTVEIANATRTLAYIRTSIPGATVSTNGDCDCEAIDDGPYTDPATDDTDWYEPTWPESADFLGITLDPMTFLPGWQRPVSQRPNGGATIGTPRLPGRTLAVSGIMWATSLAGMAWGERWLTEALHAGCGDGCCTADICVYPTCPPAGACADDYLRTIRDAALVDGPTFSAVIDERCVAQGVAFQMTSSFGFLFSEPLLIAQGTLATGS
jgi:hypothetical protein